MTKLIFKSLIVLAPVLWLPTITSAQAKVLELKSEDGSKELNVGGVIRFNQRYQSWGDDKYNSGLGDPDFDIFA